MSRYKQTKQNIGPNPKSMTRPKQWSEEVEEVYRFQLAGFRDKFEYVAFKQIKGGNPGDGMQIDETDGNIVDRWPHNGYVKKLQRKDGCFYYYNKTRECPDKEVNKCKIYVY